MKTAVFWNLLTSKELWSKHLQALEERSAPKFENTAEG
jgi:hypothetical protein